MSENAASADQLLRGLSLPTMPEALQAMRAETSRANPDIDRITRIIAADAGMAAEVLKAVNSPAFGLSQRVGSVGHAVVMLGLDYVVSLATAMFMRAGLGRACNRSFDRFWDTAGDVAVAGGALARQFGGGAVSADAAYTLGLLHDAAIPLLICRIDGYGEALAEAERDSAAITALERQRFGLDHTRVGYRLATAWQLPEPIARAIRHHHDLRTALQPDAGVADEVLTLIALLKMAEHVSHRFRGLAFRNRTDDWEWEEVKQAVFDFLSVTEEDFEDECEGLLVELGGR